MSAFDVFGPSGIARIRRRNIIPDDELTGNCLLGAEMALLLPMVRRALTSGDDTVLSHVKLTRRPRRLDHSNFGSAVEHSFRRTFFRGTHRPHSLHECRQQGDHVVDRVWRVTHDLVQVRGTRLPRKLRSWVLPKDDTRQDDNGVLVISSRDYEDVIVSLDEQGRIVDVHSQHGYEEWDWS